MGNIKNKFWLLGVCSSKFKIIIIENNRIIEANTCVIKYFKVASEENLSFEVVNKGVIDKRLISNPIHILNQEYEEIVIKVPNIVLMKNKILKYFKIKKERGGTFINGVWTQ